MNTNYIKGKIMENGLTQREVAGLLGMDPVTLSFKINGKSEFNRTEMARMAEILHTDVVDLFFRDGRVMG